MFLEDKLREQLPRQLRLIEIWVWDMPHLDWEPTLVIFYANGDQCLSKSIPKPG